MGFGTLAASIWRRVCSCVRRAVTIGFAGGFAQSAGMVVGDITTTGTSYAGRTYANNAIANVNAFGMLLGQDGNGSVNFPFLSSYRTSFKLQLFLLSNSRYWFGLGTFDSGSPTGTNGTQILGTTKYATDTPNSNTVGFRFSSGTDTDFQAVVVTADGSQTTVDTDIVADLSPHIFEFCPNSTGTAITFFIDSKQVATISTNLPTLVSGRGSYGSLFWVLDNKNTATATKIGCYFMESVPKWQ